MRLTGASCFDRVFFANSGADNIEIKLGTFNIGGDLNSPGGATPTPATGSASPNPQDDIDSSNATSKQKTASKNVLEKIGTTKGSFQFPLLTDPLSPVGLLLGKDANLFSYDLPGLDLNKPITIKHGRKENAIDYHPEISHLLEELYNTGDHSLLCYMRVESEK